MHISAKIKHIGTQEIPFDHTIKHKIYIKKSNYRHLIAFERGLVYID